MTKSSCLLNNHIIHPTKVNVQSYNYYCQFAIGMNMRMSNELLY